MFPNTDFTSKFRNIPKICRNFQKGAKEKRFCNPRNIEQYVAYPNGVYATRTDAETAIIEYIEMFLIIGHL